MAKLISLAESDKKRTEFHTKRTKQPVKNGIACPLCHSELYDLSHTLMSDPPKRQVWCKKCNLTTYRIA